eukprot:UN23497
MKPMCIFLLFFGITSAMEGENAAIIVQKRVRGFLQRKHFENLLTKKKIKEKINIIKY